MSRRARNGQTLDPLGPPMVRQLAASGPTAVQRTRFRDPDDLRPNQRSPREIEAYRVFCPLRHMMRRQGTQITLRHIAAADALRGAVDVAVIGMGGQRGEFLRAAYGPISGPTAAALRQSAAMREAVKALTRLAPSQRLLVTEIVLFNRSLAYWCAAVPGRNAHVEMGRLLAVLDVLSDHYSAEIDRDEASGRTVAA